MERLQGLHTEVVPKYVHLEPFNMVLPSNIGGLDVTAMLNFRVRNGHRKGKGKNDQIREIASFENRFWIDMAETRLREKRNEKL